MKGHGAKFSRKMEAAVAALLTQPNVDAAARTAGISVATLMRWQKEPEFQKAYREARRAAFGQAIARLQQMSGRGGGHARQDDGRADGAALHAGASRRMHHQSWGQSDRDRGYRSKGIGTGAGR
jgi:hypothetical protein